MWYWAALCTNEKAHQVVGSNRQGFIRDLKTLRGVEKRLSAIKGSRWKNVMKEIPSRIEVYTYTNVYDEKSYTKVKEWTI